jgi:ribonuclease VapC
VNALPEYVLDSTALIALVSQEPGHERVTEILERATISAVNLTETIQKLVQRGSPRGVVERLLRNMQLTVTDWSESMAYRSAEFAMLGRSHGLSLGDRACLTLAKQLNATAVTADRAWRQVSGLGVSLLIFR